MSKLSTQQPQASRPAKRTTKKVAAKTTTKKATAKKSTKPVEKPKATRPTYSRSMSKLAKACYKKFGPTQKAQDLLIRKMEAIYIESGMKPDQAAKTAKNRGHNYFYHLCKADGKPTPSMRKPKAQPAAKKPAAKKPAAKKPAAKKTTTRRTKKPAAK